MKNRAGIVCVAVCMAGALSLTGLGARLQAQAGARIINIAELADVSLAAFHNNLFRFSSDHITDDHGVRMGSFGSDLFPGDSYNEFWAVTDRGPNGNPGRRTFIAPSFDPVIMNVRVHGTGITVLNSFPILDAAGLPVSGVSNVPAFDETPFNFDGTAQIAYNPNGLDTEGIVRTADGTFWLVDEYSPSLIHVGSDGRVIDRFVPADSLLGATLATTPNYRVKKYLPAILNKRRQNRGFEGLAVTPDSTTLFLAMQSPLDYPTNALGRASRLVRILRFDIGSERVTGEFVYQFDEVCAFSGQAAGCPIVPGEMKISGLIAVSATSLLVLERTDPIAKVYRAELSGASNILGSAWDTLAASPGATTPALESLSNPAGSGVTVMPKTLLVNLAALGNMPTKIEGIALASGRNDVLVVANDNDFGMIDAPTFNAGGRMTSDTLAKSQLIYIQLAAPVN